MQITDFTGWTRIDRQEDLPTDARLYRAYCDNAKVVFRRPKTSRLLAAMFHYGEVTHYQLWEGTENRNGT